MSSPRRTDLTNSQNFLRSPRLVDHLVRTAGLGPSDLVVEIGPGKGIITERLAASCRQVLAVEKDPALARALRRRLAGHENVALFETDFREFPLPISSYKVFASIPFNHTAAIIGQLTREQSAPADTFVVVQAEAASRFLGRPRESLPSLLLKPWFEPAIVHRFARGDFMPAPRVDVVMLRLKKRGPPLVPVAQAQVYRDLVTALLTGWQPTLSAAIARQFDRETACRLIRQTGRPLDQRPTRIPFATWLALYEAYLALGMPDHHRRVTGAEERLRAQQSRLDKSHRTRVAGREGRR